MEEVTRFFNHFDANGDGKISTSELANILRALGPEPTEQELEMIMAEMDMNGDGFIDLKEFTDFCHGWFSNDGDAGSDCTEDLREAFDIYDKDKNGLISAVELHTVLKSLGEKSTLRDCKKMISLVDVDGDGHVNFEEFKKMMGHGKL